MIIYTKNKKVIKYKIYLYKDDEYRMTFVMVVVTDDVLFSRSNVNSSPSADKRYLSLDWLSVISIDITKKPLGQRALNEKPYPPTSCESI